MQFPKEDLDVGKLAGLAMDKDLEVATYREDRQRVAAQMEGLVALFEKTIKDGVDATNQLVKNQVVWDRLTPGHAIVRFLDGEMTYKFDGNVVGVSLRTTPDADWSNELFVARQIDRRPKGNGEQNTTVIWAEDPKVGKGPTTDVLARQALTWLFRSQDFR